MIAHAQRHPTLHPLIHLCLQTCIYSLIHSFMPLHSFTSGNSVCPPRLKLALNIITPQPCTPVLAAQTSSARSSSCQLPSSVAATLTSGPVSWVGTSKPACVEGL